VENPIKLISKLHKESLTTSVFDTVFLGDLAEAVIENRKKPISAKFLDDTSSLVIEAITLMIKAGLNPVEVTKVLNTGVQQRIKVCRSGVNTDSKLLRQKAFQEILNDVR
jgi:hypothetical protein